MSDDLTAFLLARITEDEASSRDSAAVYPTPWEVVDRGWMATVKADGPSFPEVVRHEDQSHDGWMGGHVEHVARWDPARVLAECEAKRHITNLHDSYGTFDLPDGQCTACSRGTAWPCPTLRLLSQPYADHPDYRQEWAP